MVAQVRGEQARPTWARRAVVIRHVAFEDLGTLTSVLEGRGYEIRYVDAGVEKLGDEAMLDADLLVVLGGPVGLADRQDYPFLDDELQTVRAWLDHGLPTLGICLGAQLVAAALGAQVRSTGRVEIGFRPLTLTGEGEHSVLAELRGTPVLHWHGDEFNIPRGAERLAGTPGFPNQAFTHGWNVLALQPHLELDHHHIERWLLGHAHELATHGLDVPALRRDAHEHGASLARAARRLLGRWLDQLEPPVEHTRRNS